MGFPMTADWLVEKGPANGPLDPRFGQVGHLKNRLGTVSIKRQRMNLWIPYEFDVRRN